ncbi:hypothetical protein Vadar_004418 [Vaccinium darrowii]|uniref:Uncharacterized protein n=1 Tax=Vaccinium darrowii TaxID=229202 RepID=A0ACB7YV16_9ERIC|nr:hypothetical protein Vadar_004418 [Vaccinium darrowii]
MEGKILFYNIKRDKTKYLILCDDDGAIMFFHLNEDDVYVFVEEKGQSNETVSVFYPSTRESIVTDNFTSHGGLTIPNSSHGGTIAPCMQVTQVTNRCSQKMGLVPYLSENGSDIMTRKGQLFDSPDLFKQAITVFAEVLQGRQVVLVTDRNPSLLNGIIKRWDKMDTNPVEYFNNWIMPLRDLDIIQFMTRHVLKVTDMLVRNHVAIQSWKLPVGDKIEEDIKKAQFVARKYMHRPTSPTEFIVYNTQRKMFACLVSCRARWIPANLATGHKMKHLERVKLVVALVKSCVRDGLGGARVELKDPTGSAWGFEAEKANEVFEGKIKAGVCLIMREIVIWRHGKTTYLNITSRNLEGVFEE